MRNAQARQGFIHPAAVAHVVASGSGGERTLGQVLVQEQVVGEAGAVGEGDEPAVVEIARVVLAGREGAGDNVEDADGAGS
jgi:hypothetical protein